MAEESSRDEFASRRNFLLATAGTIPAIAGCSDSGSDDGSTPDDSGDDAPSGNSTANSGDSENAGNETAEEAQDVEAVVGDRIESDTLAFVVEGVETTNRVGSYGEPDEGNTFVVVTMAVKNRTDDQFADFSPFMQAVLRDEENYTYTSTFYGTGRPLESGQLAPGEVARGDIVFEVPEDASGYVLRFDLEAFSFTNLNRVNIDLESEADSVARLEQDLDVDVRDVGEGVSKEGWEITLNGVRTAQEIDYDEAEDGFEYVIPNITVTNDSGETESVSVGLQMVMKDGEGWQYRDDSATYALDRQFEGGEFEDGETRRGEIAYHVEEGTAPLYWAAEFGLFTEGTKTFWQVR